MVDASHDALFRYTFSKPEYAAVELRAVLPRELLEQIDLSTLKPEPELTVGKDLSVRHCDILYTATIQGEPGYICLLLEHQSTVDRLMPFRILEYVVRLLSKHLELVEQKLPLPVVIPVVVHHSDAGWTASTEVAELFSPSIAEDADLARHIPSLSFFLDDISQASDEALKARAEAEVEQVVPLVFWALRDARDRERLLAGVAAYAHLMAAVQRSPSGKDALIAVFRYLSRAKAELSREQLETIIAEALPQPRETLMTLAEQWEQEGLKKGLQQGLQQGQREIVAKLLKLRFGELSAEIEARVNMANETELERIAERVLTARTLEEVFD